MTQMCSALLKRIVSPVTYCNGDAFIEDSSLPLFAVYNTRSTPLKEHSESELSFDLTSTCMHRIKWIIAVILLLSPK